MTSWSTRRKLNSKERRYAAAVGNRYNKAIFALQEARNEINELIRIYDGVVTQEELALALDVDRNIIREAKLRLGLPRRQRTKR